MDEQLEIIITMQIRYMKITQDNTRRQHFQLFISPPQLFFFFYMNKCSHSYVLNNIKL